MILAEHHIDFVHHGLALINALALAKVMLVARHLHLGELKNVPLIYPTLLKSALFTTVLAVSKFWKTLSSAFFAMSLSNRVLPNSAEAYGKEFLLSHCSSSRCSSPSSDMAN